MKKTFIGVRDVDEEIFRKFRVFSIKRKIKIGEALTIAMKNILKKEANTKIKTPLFSAKPIDFGDGTEKMSEEIDKIIYR